MKNPRQIAAEALMRVDTRGAWSNLALDSLLAKYKPDSRDSAFASALFYGALERLITLDACIAAHSSKPPEALDPAVRASLRLGVYQLLYMDAVPDSAAVNESAELVKRLRKTQAAGFVNGVLRSFLRAKKHIPIPDKSIISSLSVEHSCPTWIVELWIKSYGEEAAKRLLAGSTGRPPLYLRANPALITPDELISRLAAHEVIATPDPMLPLCLATEGAGAPQKLPEYRRGFFHVQDKSSQLCALALGAKPGMRVLDACAAPGGKAFTMAQNMENSGELVAADLHSKRAELIARRAKDMKLSCIRAITADMSRYDESLGLFDRVLCDAPCSGLGVIRRKPEIKYKDPGDLENLPSIQYKILETAAQYCKAGGLLMYSTCTLNPAENEDVAARLLREHPEYEPAQLPEILGGKHERSLLAELDADGFYYALFRRKD